MDEEMAAVSKEKEAIVTACDVRQLLSYDEQSGIFRWKVATNRKVVVGSIAGSVHAKSGRCTLRINGRDFRASRVAWLYVYGEWPQGLIDHRDLNKGNDAISNLRESTLSQNGANSHKRSGNSSGFKGVRLVNGKWRSKITFKNETISLGTFDDPEEAHAAYCDKSRELFGEFARAD